MSESAVPTRITATPPAREAITHLRAARGGSVMFVQSGGCCAGSSPMCYPEGEFVVGDIEVLLGDIDGCPFYIDRCLDQAWHQDQFLLDVAEGAVEGAVEGAAEGAAEGFSLPAGDNLRFITTSPTCVTPGE